MSFVEVVHAVTVTRCHCLCFIFQVLSVRSVLSRRHIFTSLYLRWRNGFKCRVGTILEVDRKYSTALVGYLKASEMSGSNAI